MEVPSECPSLSATTHEEIRELKRLQRRLTELQVEGAAIRDAFGLRVLEALRRKFRRAPLPEAEFCSLSEQIRAKEQLLRGKIDSPEMSDANFSQYLPCGDRYVRIPMTCYPQLSEYFFHQRPTVSLEPVRERFEAIVEQFAGYVPDLRFLSFVAVIAASPSKFDMEHFTAWDERLAGMFYRAGTNLKHPNTYHRFLIHTLLYGLSQGSLEDRYIGLRIGWELFREQWRSVFHWPFRALVVAAQLMRGIHPFPRDVEAFKTVYLEQLDRYRLFLQNFQHRATHPDSTVESQMFKEMFDNQLFADESQDLGIPEHVLITAARLVCLPVSIYEIFRRLIEVLRGDDVSFQLAATLIDTPLYFKNRHVDQRPVGSAFDERVYERYTQARQTPSLLRLKPLHAAFIALQPGPVTDSIAHLNELAQGLNHLPESARYPVSLLLMDGAMPWVVHRRLIYPLWLAEGLG